MTWLPLYFGDGRLGIAELCAAVLDGDLVPLGEGYVAADTVETMALRAGSLRALALADTAFTHASAAWVLGGRDDPPPRHALGRIGGSRSRQRQDPRYVYRDTLVPAADVIEIAGVAITSPPRTVVDLLRDGEPDAERLVGRILSAHPGTLDAARDWLCTRPPVPGKRAALARLDRYDEVTR